MTTHEPANLAQAMTALKPKAKTPASARILNSWIAQAQDRLGASGPRLGWLVAATVVSAVLQRAVDESGSPRFLLKGGTMLQYRLPGMSRTTQDVDGLVRGDIDKFLADLDPELTEPWGPLTLVRGPVEAINVPQRVIKPRRFDITVLLNGVTWRRIQVELSPDEGHAGATSDLISSPSLAGFGLPTPDHLVGLSMRYQIAQKIHAASDPHEPPAFINDRARDVVDLLMLRDLVEATGEPALASIRAAVKDVFAVRAREAESTGGTPRAWPTTLTAYPHWQPSFARAAESAELGVPMSDAVSQLNAWLRQIDHAARDRVDDE